MVIDYSRHPYAKDLFMEPKRVWELYDKGLVVENPSTVTSNGFVTIQKVEYITEPTYKKGLFGKLKENGVTRLEQTTDLFKIPGIEEVGHVNGHTFNFVDNNGIKLYFDENYLTIVKEKLLPSEMEHLVNIDPRYLLKVNVDRYDKNSLQKLERISKDSLKYILSYQGQYNENPSQEDKDAFVEMCSNIRQDFIERCAEKDNLNKKIYESNKGRV